MTKAFLSDQPIELLLHCVRVFSKTDPQIALCLLVTTGGSLDESMRLKRLLEWSHHVSSIGLVQDALGSFQR